MVVVVILDPASDQSNDCLGIRQRYHLDVIALQRLYEGRAIVRHWSEDMASEIPLLCGLCTGVKQGFSLSWRAEICVSFPM